MAIQTFKAVSKLKSGLAVEASARDFKITIDEPASMGGSNTGMNPMEGLLAVVGACQTIVAASFAKAQGVDLQDLWIEMEGDLDPQGFLHGKAGVRPGFQEIRYVFHIKSSSPPEKLEAFREFVESRCPVSDTVIHGTGMEGVTDIRG